MSEYPSFIIKEHAGYEDGAFVILAIKNLTILNIICWVAGSIVSATKHLLDQVLF